MKVLARLIPALMFVLLAALIQAAPIQAEEPLKVCLVSGSEEYKSDVSLAAFKEHLEATYPVKCTLIKAVGFDRLDGTEALEDCDVALFYTRRLTIEGEALLRVLNYFNSGKPVVAIRTASHGFQSYLELDKIVLGGNYQGHYGNGKVTTATVVEDQKDHPILRGVPATLESNYSLYKTTPLADDCQVLMTGTAPDADAPHPTAWTREVNGGRVFYTSLGGLDDFANADFRQMVVNALFWTARRETPEEPVAAKQAARVLMVTQSAGYQHGSVTRADGKPAPAEEALTALGVTTGLFRVTTTQDVARDFTREALDAHDIVFFYTTGALPIAPETLDYFVNDWAKQKGHGFIGTHSATDTYHDYEPYWEMIGGTFDGHPWGSGESVTVTVHDQDHPASRPWGEEFTITDEIYKFKNWQPEKVRVLMSLNMAKTSLKQPYHVPIAWVKEYGEGRVFYISLGHREDVWTNPKYMESLAGGIRWILGQEEGNATPNPELSAEQESKAKADAQ